MRIPLLHKFLERVFKGPVKETIITLIHSATHSVDDTTHSWGLLYILQKSGLIVTQVYKIDYTYLYIITANHFSIRDLKNTIPQYYRKYLVNFRHCLIDRNHSILSTAIEQTKCLSSQQTGHVQRGSGKICFSLNIVESFPWSRVRLTTTGLRGVYLSTEPVSRRLAASAGKPDCTSASPWCTGQLVAKAERRAAAGVGLGREAWRGEQGTYTHVHTTNGSCNEILDSASFSISKGLRFSKSAILVFERLLHWSCWYFFDAASLPVVREYSWTDRHTDRQTKYSNPRCACVPRGTDKVPCSI